MSIVARDCRSLIPRAILFVTSVLVSFRIPTTSVDSDDNILVANCVSTDPVRVFKADGTLVKNISITGHGGAVGVCMDPEGRIIATDHGNNRILVI